MTGIDPAGQLPAFVSREGGAAAAIIAAIAAGRRDDAELEVGAAMSGGWLPQLIRAQVALANTLLSGQGADLLPPAGTASADVHAGYAAARLILEDPHALGRYPTGVLRWVAYALGALIWSWCKEQDAAGYSAYFAGLAGIRDLGRIGQRPEPDDPEDAPEGITP